MDWDIPRDLTQEMILARLQGLNENKKCGGDGVRSIVLKRAATSFAYPLFFIFQQSLIRGEIPVECVIFRVLSFI